MAALATIVRTGAAAEGEAGAPIDAMTAVGGRTTGEARRGMTEEEAGEPETGEWIRGTNRRHDGTGTWTETETGTGRRET